MPLYVVRVLWAFYKTPTARLACMRNIRAADTHQNRFKTMNRNMSHRFTFESKRTFYFTKTSTSFPLATSCPESAGQSVCLRYPTRPIFRFGTRPSTDRAVTPLPERYGICPEGRAFVVLISAVYSRSGLFWRHNQRHRPREVDEPSFQASVAS